MFYRISRATPRRAFTLVEMLVAMAITLVMMAAVVTLFANVGESIQNRRATIELDSQLRHVRNLLQQDLANSTCPALTWQRPEWNRGYIEIVEGLYSDQNPSMYTDGNDDTDGDMSGDPDELDPEVSFVPRGNNGQLMTDVPMPPGASGSTASVPSNGLGDWDDILALTCRNEAEPFVGRVPTGVRQYNSAGTVVQPNPANYAAWQTETIRSPLAEVVWFAVENPMNDTGGFMGEPGFRTVYRRVLLIAPWLNPYRGVEKNSSTPNQPIDYFGPVSNRIRTKPGMVRVLPDSVDRGLLPVAFASLISFQERYDLSVRLEFDPSLGDDGRWVIMANTLGDLTKRENRFGHFGFDHTPAGFTRVFPYPLIAGGTNQSNQDVFFAHDPELMSPPPAGFVSATNVEANIVEGTVISYFVPEMERGKLHPARPFAFVDDVNATRDATANAILNDDGQIVHVVKGPVPLWGPRRGEDVILSDVLAFDIRVYDPGAPLYPEPGLAPTDANFPGTVLEPGDPGWAYTALDDVNMTSNPNPIGVGAYVDLGYWNNFVALCWARGYWTNPNNVPAPNSLRSPSDYEIPNSVFAGWMHPKAQFEFVTINNYPLYPYRVYDTWSWHYENNGLNDNLPLEIEHSLPQAYDEGTNGLDDVGLYLDPVTNALIPNTVLGPDDVGERETSPPYDVPLRGIQVKLRAYERDSRQIRETVVQQAFVPE